MSEVLTCIQQVLKDFSAWNCFKIVFDIVKVLSLLYRNGDFLPFTRFLVNFLYLELILVIYLILFIHFFFKDAENIPDSIEFSKKYPNSRASDSKALWTVLLNSRYSVTSSSVLNRSTFKTTLRMAGWLLGVASKLALLDGSWELNNSRLSNPSQPPLRQTQFVFDGRNVSKMKLMKLENCAKFWTLYLL